MNPLSRGPFPDFQTFSDLAVAEVVEKYPLDENTLLRIQSFQQLGSFVRVKGSEPPVENVPI